MLRNYLTAALRNLVRNKLYAAINITGLAVGFAAALLIALLVRDDLSYDKWLPNADKIYMMGSKLAIPNNEPLYTYLIPEEIIPPLPLDFPSIDKVVRLQPSQNNLRHGEIEFADQKIYFADPGFFSMIQLPVLAGDLKTALDTPESAVLTVSAARKYFGKDAPIGETLEIDRTNTVKITAVLRDLPSNTQFNTEVIVSSLSPISSATRKAKVPPDQMGWGVGSYIYLTLKPGASIAEQERGLPDFLARHKPNTIDFVGKSPLYYQPMLALHLHSITQGGSFYTLNPVSSMATISAISVVGFLILFIAGVNFVNMSTARASRRAMEVGIRKASGAKPSDLMIQFIGESLIYVVVAMLIALAAVSVALPALNGYLGRTVLFHFWADPQLLGGIIGTMLVTGILAGVYPALVLSRFRPAIVLKSGKVQSGASSILRSILVVLQFAILISLVVVTLVVYRQTAYALERGVKLNTQRIDVMARGCSQAMQDAVRATPGVEGIACSAGQIVGQGRNAARITLKDGSQLTVEVGPTGYDFFELYDIKPIAGRVFQRDHADQPADVPPTPPGQTPPPSSFTAPLIVNETLARKINPGNPKGVVGQYVKFGGAPGSTGESEIIGVVPDFAIDATHLVVPPTVYFMLQQRQITNGGLLSVKLTVDADEKAVFKAIDETWKTIGPPRPVSRYAMKDFLTNLNADVIRQSHVFATFAIIAVFIAALGLLGLSAFTAERRTKEFGVRKALGANRIDILRLLLWQFAKPVLWANLIAWPAGYFIMRHWLAGFASHVNLEPWIFLAASVLALVIAVLTVLGQALHIARVQPASALRYE